MKKLSLFVFAALLSTLAFAQPRPATIMQQRSNDLPFFKILGTDSSTTHMRESLTKTMPVIMIMFSADCEHCEQEAQELVKHKNKLKDVQIVMASLSPITELKTFYSKNKLSELPHLMYGKDYLFFFTRFFKFSSYPFMAIYNKNHQLITALQGDVGITRIMQELSK
jgi:hypothetical protein